MYEVRGESRVKSLSIIVRFAPILLSAFRLGTTWALPLFLRAQL